MGSANILGFAFVLVAILITPGPNVAYLVSRTLAQGKRAGFVSLFGSMSGSLCYIIATSLGLTAIFFTIPITYKILKFGGAAYLTYLAWQTVKPNGKSFLTPQNSSQYSNRQMFVMGLTTSLLNPKVAILCISILPNYINKAAGHIFAQSIALGLTHLILSFIFNGIYILFAAKIAGYLNGNQKYMNIQRYFVGAILGLLAINILCN